MTLPLTESPLTHDLDEPMLHDTLDLKEAARIYAESFAYHGKFSEATVMYGLLAYIGELEKPVPAPAASSADDGVKCKTCRDTKKVIIGMIEDYTVSGDCPDCAPDTREEKQAKCACGESAPVCKRTFAGGIQGLSGICMNTLNGGTICGHPAACHKGDTGNE